MSLGTLTDVARAFSMLCDVAAAVSAVKGLATSRDQGDQAAHAIYTAQTINRFICLGFSFAEVGCLLGGVSPGILSALKQAEGVPRMINIPLTYGTAAMEAPLSDLKSRLKVFEKGVVYPCLDMLRTAAQATMYDGQYNLQQLDADPNATKDVFVSDGHGGGYNKKVPINRQEIELSIRISTIVADSAAIGAAATYFGVVDRSISGVVNGSVAIYVRLAHFLGLQRPEERQPLPQAAVPMAAPIEPLLQAAVPMAAPIEPLPQAAVPMAAPIEPLPQAAVLAPKFATLDDLLDTETGLLRNIPLPLHDDVVFSQYICPITRDPIRDPVRDPTNNLTLYDRSAITNALRFSQESPMTRLPLTVKDLIDEDAIKAIIDYRLQFHQDKLRAYLAQVNESS